MSNTESEQEFFSRADKFIFLANEQCQNAISGKVSSSLLYAAARFSAYDMATKSDSASEMQKDKLEAIEFFCGRFREMLIENLDDYIANYDQYVSQSRDA
ncbi:MAG: DUF3144 domain-containing protein [Arenimonas sp.]